MAERARPKPPAGLAGAGKTLWKAIQGDLPATIAHDARELHLLTRACRCADELAKLEEAIDKDGITVTGSKGQPRIHPAVAEARQLRLTQLRLLGAIEMDETPARSTFTSRQASHAARVRWDLEASRG